MKLLFLIALCLCTAVLARPAARPTDSAAAASDDGQYHEELYGFHLYDDPKSYNGDEEKEEAAPVQSVPMTNDGGDSGDDGQYREEPSDSMQSDDNEQNQEQSVDDGHSQDQSVDDVQDQSDDVQEHSDDGQEQSDDGQFHDESGDQSDHQPALTPMAPVADEGDDGQYREEDTQSHDTQSDDDGQYHPQTYEDGQY